MKLSLQHSCRNLTALCCLVATTGFGDIIVNWGVSGGDTGIVTANANGTVSATYSGSYISPANGASGYNTGAAGQTREYYGAIDQASSVFGLVNLGGGDQIQMVKNFGGTGGTVTSMIAWESPDFMTSARALDSFTMEFETRGGASTANYLIETTAGWYQSTQTFTDDDLTTINSAVGDLTWSGFSGFAVSAGGGTADTDNIVSVGTYFSSTIATGNWTGAKLQHFSVSATASAVPEPSSLALLFLGGGLLVGLGRKVFL